MNFSNSNWWFCSSTVRKLHFRIYCYTTYVRHRDHYNPWNGTPFVWPSQNSLSPFNGGLLDFVSHIVHYWHSIVSIPNKTWRRDFQASTKSPTEMFQPRFFSTHRICEKKHKTTSGFSKRLKWKKKASNSDLRVLWWSAFLGQKRFVSWVSWWCQTDQRGLGVRKIPLIKRDKNAWVI